MSFVSIHRLRRVIAAGVAVATLISVTMTLSCSLAPPDPGWDYGLDGATYAEITSLFVSDEGGCATFITNEVSYHSPRGYTIWCEAEGLGGPANEPFSEVSCAVSKETGDATAGFGLVLCRGENGSGDSTMYVVMINVKRQYAIGKAVNARYIPIKTWTESSALLAGWGAENRIRVTYDGSTNRYAVLLNGTVAWNFENDGEVNDSGGAGYLAVISPYDDFPETTVKIVFSR